MSVSTAARTSKKGCTVALLQCICCALLMRQAMISQQMCWSRRGADLLLQVRCAVYNGTLGSGFGQRFQPVNDPYAPMAVAA